MKLFETIFEVFDFPSPHLGKRSKEKNGRRKVLNKATLLILIQRKSLDDGSKKFKIKQNHQMIVIWCCRWASGAPITSRKEPSLIHERRMWIRNFRFYFKCTKCSAQLQSKQTLRMLIRRKANEMLKRLEMLLNYWRTENETRRKNWYSGSHWWTEIHEVKSRQPSVTTEDIVKASQRTHTRSVARRTCTDQDKTRWQRA